MKDADCYVGGFLCYVYLHFKAWPGGSIPKFSVMCIKQGTTCICKTVEFARYGIIVDVIANTLQWRHNERDGVSNHMKALRHWPLWEGLMNFEGLFCQWFGNDARGIIYIYSCITNSSILEKEIDNFMCITSHIQCNRCTEIDVHLTRFPTYVLFRGLHVNIRRVCRFLTHLYKEQGFYPLYIIIL